MKKAIVLSALVSIGYGAYAQEQIPINNPSFEDPVALSWPDYTVGVGIPGWTVSGSSEVGVWNTSAYGGTIAPAPDGAQIGFIDGNGILTSVSQTLSTALQADSTYNLSIEVSGRTDQYTPGTDYSISLYAGGNLLTSVVPVAPPVGSWATLDATYTSGDFVPAGEDLEIVISTSATQLDFDNVQLIDPPAVPDGGSTAVLGGMGLVALGWMRRKLA